MELIFWGAILRFFQVFVYSAPWIVFGFVIAGVFDRLIGRQATKEMFGGEGLSGIFFGWLWGMLLPVCSLGVIPVTIQLHRSGVKGGALIAFALTAPLFNPLSVLYGLTLSDPFTIVIFAFCSLVIVGGVGAVWDKIFQLNSEPTESEQPVDNGIKRMIAVAMSSTGMIFGPATFYIIIGMVGSVLVSTLLPHGAMSTMLERENWVAPAATAALGTAVYSTPLLSMSQIGSMFQHGNSIGAAFSLLVFGAGVNLGLLLCFFNLYGVKKVSVFFGLLVSFGLSIAYIISEPLFPRGVEVAGHTHAFDVYTNPFHHSTQNLLQLTQSEMQKHWGNHEFGGSVMLLSLLIVGLVFMGLERRPAFIKWLNKREEKSPSFDVELPRSVLTAISIFGLIAFSIFGCYVYYPATESTLNTMSEMNTNVVLDSRLGNWEGARKWIAFQEDLSRRLEVGTFLRTGGLGKFERTRAAIYRDSLEDLKHAIEDENKKLASKIAIKVNKRYGRLRTAFQ